MGLFGVFIGLLMMVQALSAAGGNASVFLKIGESSTAIAEFAEAEIGPVLLLPDLGHDGRFFFVQASDPWITQPDVYTRLLDRPTYRAGRVAYPMVAGGFGLAPVSWLPWTLPLTNVLALGFGSWATAHLADRLRLTPLYGLAFLANPGVFNEFFISGGGVVATAAAIGALVAVIDRRWLLAPCGFCLAVLSREVMVLVVLGSALWLWRRDRLRAIVLVTVPSSALVAWTAWVWVRLGPDRSSVSLFDWPFRGFVQAARGWVQDPGADLAMGLVVLIAVTVVAVAARRRRDLLSWATFGFVVLAPFLIRPVWQKHFDLSRALAPLLTVAVLLVAQRGRQEVTVDAAEGPAQGHPGVVEDMA